MTETGVAFTEWLGQDISHWRHDPERDQQRITQNIQESKREKAFKEIPKRQMNIVQRSGEQRYSIYDEAGELVKDPHEATPE